MGFTNKRDERIVNDHYMSQDLMCAAHGCPNRWSVLKEGDKGLCSAHAWVDDRKLWPQITQEQLDFAVELAMRVPPEDKKYSREEKQEILDKLKVLLATFGQRDPRAWARDLKAREEAGKRLSHFQRQCWREALGWQE